MSNVPVYGFSPPSYRSPPATAAARQPPSKQYYTSRVKESLTGRATKCFCSLFLTLLLILGVVAFVLWLSLRPHRPRFHIESFSIPALAQDSGFQNTMITFNFTIRNPNQNIGIYYDRMDAQVYYRKQLFGTTPLPASFYQGPKNTTVVVGRVNGTPLSADDPVWQMVMADKSTVGTVIFRLELTVAVRSKVSAWNGRRDHTMHVDCEVDVGPNGLILPRAVDRRCPVYFY